MFPSQRQNNNMETKCKMMMKITLFNHFLKNTNTISKNDVCGELRNEMKHWTQKNQAVMHNSK